MLHEWLGKRLRHDLFYIYMYVFIRVERKTRTQPVNQKLQSETLSLPSVLRRYWLGDWKGIRPVENRVVGCWCGCLSGSRCRLAYGPADATATHCLLIRIGFTFLVPAHLGSSGKRAIKWVCVITQLEPSFGRVLL